MTDPEALQVALKSILSDDTGSEWARLLRKEPEAVHRILRDIAKTIPERTSKKGARRMPSQAETEMVLGMPFLDYIVPVQDPRRG